MEVTVGKKSFTDIEINNVEAALKIQLSEYNRNLIMNGNSSDLIEIDGRESKLSLQRNKKGEVLAVLNTKKEALEIPHEIQGTKLSRNDKKMLYDGHSVLINTKKGDFYLQIDKELNTVTIKGSEQMGIPDVIGDDKKHKFDGYKLTNADKELLANGHLMPPRVLCSKDGYILAEFGLTEDRKGVKFAHTISIPKNEVNNYIAKYNSNEVVPNKVYEIENNKPVVEKEIYRNLDEEFLVALSARDFEKLDLFERDGFKPSEKTMQMVQQLPNLSNNEKGIIKGLYVDERKEMYLDDEVRIEKNQSLNVLQSKEAVTDQARLNFISKDRNGISSLSFLFSKKEELADFLNKHDLQPLYDRYNELKIDRTNNKEELNKINSDFKNLAKEKSLFLVETVEKPKEIEKAPEVEKEVVVRNLDKEFMAALEVRDFKKLNDLAKDDNYDPSKKTLETAHQLPNLSDADKVAIKTIFPEKENEPTLDPKSKELDIVHDKKNNVLVKEAEEREKQGNVKEKLGHIVSGAFQSM